MVAAPRHLTLEDLCVHQVSLLGQCDFASSLAVLQRAGINRTALWAPMIESCGVAEAKRAWDDSGMVAESLCVACLFEGKAALSRMLELADMFSARTLVVITGGFEDLVSNDYGGIEHARGQVVKRLGAAAERAILNSGRSYPDDR